MSKQKKTFMDEQDFDALLTHSVPELPPEDIVEKTVPGRKALRRILIGFFFYTFTVSIMGLNLILPIIGQILVLLGFRALQHENRWFSFCYMLEVFHAIFLFGQLILGTTILDFPPDTATANRILLTIQTLIVTLSLFCFWRGLRTVQKKMGIRSRAIAVPILLGWNFLINGMGFLQLTGRYRFNGIDTLVVSFFSFIVILWMIARLAKALDETGYMLQPAPVQISDRVFTLVIVAVLAIGCSCGHLFFSSYDMAWQNAEVTTVPADEKTRAHLMALGFPEDIADDLAPEDLVRLSGAEQVVVDTALKNSADPNAYDGPYDIQLTNIIVRVSGKTSRFIIFHHFQWLISPDFYGTEALSIFPAYEDSRGWQLESAMSGHLLYDDANETWTADYHSIEAKTLTSESSFIFHPPTDIYANFTFPNQGTNQRGYVTYTVTPLDGIQSGYSQMTYIHQNQRFHYPVEAADSYNIFSINGPFESMQPAPLIFDLTSGDIQLQ